MRGYTVTLFSGAPLRSDIEVWEFWIISLGIDSLNFAMTRRTRSRAIAFAPFAFNFSGGPQRIRVLKPNAITLASGRLAAARCSVWASPSIRLGLDAEPSLGFAPSGFFQADGTIVRNRHQMWQPNPVHAILPA